MKQNKKWSMRIASFCLAGACLCGGAVLAAGGDESDPLVTLSYLTQTVTPNILKQVDEQAAKRQSELLAQLNTAIADYKMAVEGGGASGGTSASYSVVTLTSGQTLAMGVGCEVMLRVGTAGPGADRRKHRGDAEQRRRADRQPPLHGHHRGPDSPGHRRHRQAAGAGRVHRLLRLEHRQRARHVSLTCRALSDMIEAERTESPGDGRVREWRRIFPAEGDAGREERTCLWLLKCF